MSLTEMQKAYLGNCNHRWNIKTGATGSGKSFLDYLTVIPQRILACRGEGHILLLGNTQGTLERNILEPMREYWPGLVGQIRDGNKVQIFGKTAYALGADSKKHIARIQGSTVEYAYGDEITTWAQGVFEMLKSRLRCDHSHFDGTCNPDNPQHWFKKFLDSDADIFQQAYTIDDNPYLPAEFVKNLKIEYEGTVYYARYIDGLWTVAEGMIYPHYEDAIVDVLPETFTDYAVSMDYGTQNATAMLLLGKSGTTWYAIKEFYYSGRDQGVTKTDDEYFDELYTLTMEKRISELIIDPSAASFIALCKKRRLDGGHDNQYYPHVKQADNAVLDGIRETSTAMKRGLIKIHKGCKNTIAELGGYVWDPKHTEDKPIKERDHAMDALRYFVKTMKLTRERSFRVL